jgi:phytoene synthase
VRTDAERGRIYLPLSELKKFNVTEPDEILQSNTPNAYCRLAATLPVRAKKFLPPRPRNLPAEDRRSMVAAELMGSVYWRLLQKLEAKKFNVFGPQPVRLSKQIN